MTLKLSVFLVLLFAIPTLAQDTPKSIALTGNSWVLTEDIMKALKKKECSNVSITHDLTKADYTLDAIKKTDPKGGNTTFNLTLLDSDGNVIRSTSVMLLGNAVKDVCHAIRTAILVEVVDTQNLTQSVDQRGDTSGGAVGAVVNGLSGRKTHTDAATMNVIVNGEHALLDCYEHRKGCTTIGPGKYYGELDVDGRSIWINHEIPITHKPVRDHYVIAGSW
jgi:hypothetical protein